MSTTTAQTQTKGFALLIKAPGSARRFTPGQGETIAILDKNGKELWSIKVPAPNANPGVTIHEVQIDLLTERDFGNFCQKTWNRAPMDQSSTAPPELPTNPS